MFWADQIVEDFLKERGDDIKGRTAILRDEKTMSGKPHVGSLRSFVMHAVFADVLTERKIDNVFYYELNNMDAFDSVPNYVPDEWKEHLGKRLKDVPAPDGKSENYPSQFAKEYTDALKDSKYNAEYYFLSEKYEFGAFDKYMKLALDHKDEIKAIDKEESGSDKGDDWWPCQVVCEKCGKVSTTRVLSWDGKEVEYICDKDVGYTEGCGYKGKKSPFKGNATMPWKIEWAAKFCVMEVDLEGAGKDHYASGGSRHVSNRICEEIFKHKHPFDTRHEFINFQGAKMSSSSGVGATAVEVHDLLPRYLFRFMMIQKDIMKAISFCPTGDTVPVLFDQYDEVCRDYFGNDPDAMKHKKRIFEMAHFYDKDLNGLNRFLPRFSQVAFYVQVPHVDIEEKVAEMKGSALTDADKEELNLRVEYAKKWLELYSPEHYIFKIQEESVPEMAADLSSQQKEFLGMLGEFLDGNKQATGEEIQTFIHGKKEEMGIEPRDIFSAIYISILGRNSGPKAGWLLEALDRDFLIKRFKEVSK